MGMKLQVTALCAGMLCLAPLRCRTPWRVDGCGGLWTGMAECAKWSAAECAKWSARQCAKWSAGQCEGQSECGKWCAGQSLVFGRRSPRRRMPFSRSKGFSTSRLLSSQPATARYSHATLLPTHLPFALGNTLLTPTHAFRQQIGMVPHTMAHTMPHTANRHGLV